MSKTTINGVFKFRIRWSQYSDKWRLETECRAYAPDHWENPEPHFSPLEIAFGFRAMWRTDQKKTYWCEVAEGEDVEELKKKAAEYVAECVKSKRAAIEADKRAAANKQAFEFVLTATVEA